MYNICIFAGTTEGRKLASFLSTQSVLVTVCVATEYGEALLESTDNIKISSKRLSEEEMVQLFSERFFDLVIDATHPYAKVVTDHIKSACNATGIKYQRLIRKVSTVDSDAVFVSDVREAVDFLNRTEGTILLTTGSKELQPYTKIQNFETRVYVRVLPNAESLEACRNAGVKPDHIIAMQGPFSEEMNTAMLHFVSASYLVTKDGGEAGGFEKKAAAAKSAGARLVVIGRPCRESGMSFSEIIRLLCEQYDCTYKPFVTIAGIGPGNRNAMTKEVCLAVANADCLIGAKRMLEAVAADGQTVFEAISPETIAELIHSHREYQKFTVLMSGDSGFYSGTKKLLPLLSDCELSVLPGVSSLAVFCSKLRISYEDAALISMHGRNCSVVPEIRSNRYTFVLTGGEKGVNELCNTLKNAGLGHLNLTVGERLSYSDETITTGTASKLLNGSYDSLSIVLVENKYPDFVVTHGLPDALFQREMGEGRLVPMTKSEVRSVCLSKLQLTERAVCWDIGAGTGSVAIEMALQARKGQVYAVEKNDTALELLRKNKEQFALEHLKIVSGFAPKACCELPTPTHVFIGGSAGRMKEMICTLLEKNPFVRIVATAISLETVAELNDCMKMFSDTEVICINIARGKKVGDYHLMNGQNPVFVFTMQNGGGKE